MCILCTLMTPGILYHCIYCLLAPTLTAVKSFLPLITAHYRNGQLISFFESYYYILLSNVILPKTMTSWPFMNINCRPAPFLEGALECLTPQSEPDRPRTTISYS